MRLALPPVPRAALIAGALGVLGVWVWSAEPIAAQRSNPYSDGMETIPFFYATLTLLPLGLSALVGALLGDEAGRSRAQRRLAIAAALLAAVALLNAGMWAANAWQGVG